MSATDQSFPIGTAVPLGRCAVPKMLRDDQGNPDIDVRQAGHRNQSRLSRERALAPDESAAIGLVVSPRQELFRQG